MLRTSCVLRLLSRPALQAPRRRRRPHTRTAHAAAPSAAAPDVPAAGLATIE